VFATAPLQVAPDLGKGGTDFPIEIGCHA